MTAFLDPPSKTQLTDDRRIVSLGWLQWFNAVARVFRKVFGADGAVQLTPFAKASLPSAAPAGRMIFVTDDVGGATPAFSDGTDWRRVADRAVIS